MKLHRKETSKLFSVLMNRSLIKEIYNQSPIFGFQKQVCQSCVAFQSIKIASKQFIEKTLTFRQSKLLRKKYIEMTSIFRPSILRRIKYVETTWIFRPSKLRRKNTLKRLGFFGHWNYTEKIPRNDEVIRRYFLFEV